MNKETFEALKRIIKNATDCYNSSATVIKKSDLEVIEGWVDEVAKEYDSCEHENIEKGIAEICANCQEVIDFQVEE